MAAAPFKATAIIAAGSPKGPTKPFSLTVSDVNAAFYVWPSGQNFNVLSGDFDCYIVDLILSAAGTDTSQGEIFVGGVSTGFKILNATTLATTIVRPLPQAPIRVPKGQALQITQLT